MKTFEVRPELNIRTWGSYEKMRSLGDIVSTLVTSGGIEYNLDYMHELWDEFEEASRVFIEHLMQIAEEQGIKPVGAYTNLKYNISFRENKYEMEANDEDVNIRNMALGTIPQALVQTAIRNMLDKRGINHD